MRFAGTLAACALALSACGHSGPAAPQTLHVSPTGSGTACTAKKPCGTIDAAFRAAKPGERVLVARGRYGPQVVPAIVRPRPSIEIRGAGGVQIAGLDIRSSNVVVRRLSSSAYLNVDSGDPAVILDNVRLYDVNAHTHVLVGTRNFLWKRGSLGPSNDEKISFIGGTPHSTNAVYDGITWHDATRSREDVHTECLMILGVQGMTIRNSRFTNCAVFDILISRLAGDPLPRDVLIENTVLEASKDLGGKNAFYAILTGPEPLHGLTLRNNVWDLGLALQGPLDASRFSSNIGRAGSCNDGVHYSHNVFTDKRCGPTDRVVRGAFSQFVDPRKGNWRLKPRAGAIGAGDPRLHALRDAAGKPRTGRPDAGAFEFSARD